MMTILKLKCFITIALLTTIIHAANAQTDKWTGIWKAALHPWGLRTPITMQLHIGEAQQGVLYPAVITLQYGEFTGIYELLLAKKNDGQLGIGRNKYPLKETPYKLGIWMWYLNGTLDYKDNSISLSRMWINKASFWMRGLDEGDEIYEQSKVALRDFLYRGDFKLTKAGNKPLPDSSLQRIMHPETSQIYFGIYDSIVAKDSEIPLEIEDQEKYDQDTITLLHNGNVIFAREQINDHNRHLKARLDTGRNYFVLFADNYGGLPPNTGRIRTTINGRPYGFDFSDRSNAWATFLVANIYRSSADNNVDTITSNVIKRTAVPVATIPVRTADIILELKDTRMEDGDSISLRLNGQWVVTGFPVKKAIQQIAIRLQPGENILLFTADNLGSIPPNTAELRIRFGKESKTLNLSTDMKRNNEIRLVLE
ncbi:hypothetical protein [Chitinophaga sp. ARDCPP14]|uniref:hypothetical protein n=1 Tax=Chitinophaga sp. ARDCPP14 TaxID=3391139 RepID=UPI003F5256EB